MSDGLQSVTRRVASFQLSSGRTISVASLALKDFASAREQALLEYKREKIATWTSNLDLIPEDKQSEWVREAFERAESLTYEDLPTKRMHLPVYTKDGKYKRDKNGDVLLRETEVEYAMWWMSETPSGRLFMTWLSMRKVPGQESLTIEDADELFAESMMDLEQAAQLVGDLSNPRLAPDEGGGEGDSGNREAPRQAGRRRRRRRRGA